MPQRSIMRKPLTYWSFHRLSHRRICPARRLAGRSASKPATTKSAGTTPTLSTKRSTSKCFGSASERNSSILPKSTGVVKQTRFLTGPAGCSDWYIADSMPPAQ